MINNDCQPNREHINSHDIERIFSLGRAIALRDLALATSIDNLTFTCKVEEFFDHLGDYGLKFSPPPQNFIEDVCVIYSDDCHDGAGVDMPLWLETGIRSDVEVDIWVDLVSQPHQLFVKGHRIP